MPLASVITNIQFDHMPWLGNTLAMIAAEKAGIIKPGVPAWRRSNGRAACR
jgi:dihydrofolate synthase/folylpolyglutamate synthase